MKKSCTNILLILFLFSGFIASGQNPVCSFEYKKTITINGSQISGSLTNFPILISHTDPDLATSAGKVTNANGFDIIFADDNGQPLNFQMETYNAATGEYTAWVQIPALNNGIDLDIHMLYGKSTITTDQSTIATWDEDYETVWHMNQDPSGTAPQLMEFSGSGINGTSSGAMTSADLVNGKCGEGIDFDGVNDFINFGDVLIDGLSNITVEAWYNASSIPTETNPSGHNANEGAIVHKSGFSDDNIGLTISAGGVVGYIDNGSDNNATGSAPTLSTWTHIVMSWNNSAIMIYRNGVLDATQGSVSGNFINNNNSLRIGGGHTPTTPHEFDGILDEIRISSVARSADYAATSFNSQNQPTTTIGVNTGGDFYTVSLEEDIFHTSTGNGDWDAAGIWDSGEVPGGQFENVTINNDVDVDAGGSNYTVCDCFVTSNGSVATRLDVSNTRLLTVKGDLTILLAGTSNVSSPRVRVQNNATINVEGSISMTNSNTATGRDLNLQIVNNGTINVDNDFTMNATAGDDLRVNMDNNGEFNILGTFTVLQAGGDDIQIALDDNAQINLTGDLNLTQDAGDELNIDVNTANTPLGSEFNITGDCNIVKNGGDDLIVDIEEDGLMAITGDLNIEQNGGDDLFLRVYNDANLIVDGDLDIDQNGGDVLTIILNDNVGINASFIVNGNTTIDKPAGDDIIFTVEGNNSNLSFIGSTTINCPGSANTENITFNADEGGINFSNLEINRSADFGPVTFDLDGGNVTISSLLVNSSGTLSNNGSVIIDIDQTSNFTVQNNMEVNMSGGTDLRIGINQFAGVSGQFNCGGNLFITETGGRDITFYTYESSVFNVNGDLIVNQSDGEEFLFDLQDDGMVDIDGSFTFNKTGGVDAFIILPNGSNTVFNVGNDLTINNSNSGEEFKIDLDGGIVSVLGDMSINVSGIGTTEDIDLELDQTAQLLVNGDFNASLTGGDDLEIEMGSTSANATASFDVLGDITITSAVGPGAHIAELIVLDMCSFSCADLIINHTNTTGDLLLIRLANSALGTVNGNIDINAFGGGDIELSIENTSELRIAGNFDRTPSAFGALDMDNTATLEFFGTSAQIFPRDAGAGGDVFDYGIIEVNNSFGTSPQITMEGLATVHGGITFMDGVISSSNAGLLVFDVGTFSNGPSDNSHVDGVMRKTGADNFEFPSGNLGVWAPIEVTNLSGSTNFDAEYIFTDHADTDVLTPLAYRSSIEHWNLNPSSAVIADVTLHWKDANRSGINTFTTDLVVAHYNNGSSAWESYGNDFMVAANPGEVRSENVSVFSPFTFGSLSTSLTTNPLPVELLDFSAVQNKLIVDISWVTATEIDNDYFIVQRSEDGQNFEDLTRTNGAGTSSQVIYYSAQDQAPLNGLSYYRLKQVDFDGSVEYSDVVPVYFNSNSEGGKTIAVYPNPTAIHSGSLNIELKGFEGEIVLLELKDTRGKVFYSNSKALLSSTENHLIPISTDIPAGIYIVTVVSKNEMYSQKILLK